MTIGINATVGFILIVFLVLLLKYIRTFQNSSVLQNTKQTSHQTRKETKRSVWDEIACYPDVRRSYNEKTRYQAQSYYEYVNRNSQKR